MIIGVPREIKRLERRVALTPTGCRILVAAGHRVLIESGAGEGAGFSDTAYQAAGAELMSSAPDVIAASDMVVKVKEPLPPEYDLFRPGQVLFTYLHLAAEPELTGALLRRQVVAIAYETVSPDGRYLPLLQPMSEIAGRLSIQAGARCLEHQLGGRGTLLSGVPGVLPGKVVVVGGGTAGTNAARMAVGIGARVTILEADPARLRHLDELFEGRAAVLMSDAGNIAEALVDADLVVGAVLIPGDRAPKLVTREMLRTMAAGTALVDVSIDQGGCAETSRPTSHDAPTYVDEGVVHYCVTNMPGAVARTATLALTGVTLPYIRLLADGWHAAVRSNPALRRGVNTCQGEVIHPAVAAALGYEAGSLDSHLG